MTATFPPSSASSPSSFAKERLEVEAEGEPARERREELEPEGRIPLVRFLINGEGRSSASIVSRRESLREKREIGRAHV